MDKSLYTAQEVADLLGLHVKTVRRYVREGRIESTRVGKQYRISHQSLEAFTGADLDEEVAVQAPVQGEEVVSVVQLDGIGRERADRITNLLMSASRGRDERDTLRVECIYDQERSLLKVILIGSISSTTIILDVIGSFARG